MHRQYYETTDDMKHVGRDLFLDILTIIAVCWIAFRGCCKSCCKSHTRDTEGVVLANAAVTAAAAPEITITTLDFPNTVEIPIGGNYSELWEEWNGSSLDDPGQEPPPSYDEAVNGYWTRMASVIHV